MKWIQSLQDSVQNIREDEKSMRVLRYAILFILFLTLTLVGFFALRAWHAPALPPDGFASTRQNGLFTVGAGMLVAGVLTAAVAAYIDSDPALSSQFAGGFRVVSFKKKNGKTSWNH